MLVHWLAEWGALRDMQDFAGRYFDRLLSGDLAQRASLASNELLENAARYATAGSEIVFEVWAPAVGFKVRVTNHAVDSRIALLRKHLQDVQSPAGQELYRRALRRVYADGDQATGGLGLFRAKHEAQTDLEVEIDRPRVAVVATSLGDAWSTTPSTGVARSSGGR